MNWRKYRKYRQPAIITGAALLVVAAFLFLLLRPCPCGEQDTKKSNQTSLGKPKTPEKPKAVTEMKNVTPSTLIAEVNKHRVAAGLRPLTLYEALNESARRKCVDMFKGKYFAHANPITGRQGYDVARVLVGDPSGNYGENLIKSAGEPNDRASKYFVDRWMNSPTHKANILDPDYTEAGFAVCGIAPDGKWGNWYAVNHFYGN
jgi:uncharacterized protein YkwD